MVMVNNMERSAWHDLPNAKHIDRILAHLKANPDKWCSARLATYNNGDYYEAYYTGGGAVWYAANNAAAHAASYATWRVTNHAALSATLALIAWDDCAYLLDQKPAHVKIMALLGHQAAILIEPAVIAMYEETLETV